MRIIVIVYFLLIAGSSYSQNRLFQKVDIKEEAIETGLLKNFDKYDLADFVLYRGKYENNLKYHLINKATGEVLLEEDHSNSDAMILKPKFFVDTNSVLTIIMMEIAAEYSWGQEVIWIDSEVVKNIGNLDYTVDNFNFTSISEYCKISFIDGKVIMEFDDVTIIDTREEAKLDGKKLKFELSNEGIVRIK